MKRSYEEESTNLAKAIDIGMQVIKNAPPKNFEPTHVHMFLKSYAEYKHNALYPDPQFRTLASLKYINDSFFSYYQEGAGKTVDLFWQEVKAQGLPYKRENRLKKILERKKIKSVIEYDYAVDTIVPFEQEGMINKKEAALLKQMIGDFEKKKAEKAAKRTRY